MLWNLNGLRARWKGSRLSLQDVVRKQQPDVLVLAESRTDHQHVLKLAGFEDWLRKEGYLFWYFIGAWRKGERGLGRGNDGSFQDKAA